MWYENKKKAPSLLWRNGVTDVMSLNITNQGSRVHNEPGKIHPGTLLRRAGEFDLTSHQSRGFTSTL